MKTLAKRLRKEQREKRKALKERNAALHQAEVQRKMKERAAVLAEMSGKIIAYMLEEHCRGEVEIEIEKLMKEDGGRLVAKEEDGKLKIKLLASERNM